MVMPSLSREAFLVSVWLSVSATWLCCTRCDGPLDAVVLATFPVGDEHNLAAWTKRSPGWSGSRPFPCTGAAGGPKRSLAALAALPSPAVSSSNWHCETSTQFLLQGYVRAATMS